MYIYHNRTVNFSQAETDHMQTIYFVVLWKSLQHNAFKIYVSCNLLYFCRRFDSLKNFVVAPSVSYLPVTKCPAICSCTCNVALLVLITGYEYHLDSPIWQLDGEFFSAADRYTTLLYSRAVIKCYALLRNVAFFHLHRVTYAMLCGK